MKVKTVLILSFIFVVSSCATGYQRQGFTGGFSETQLDTNLFRVTFNGNAYTSRDKANDYTLLRSAELALSNGFNYFMIIDEQQTNSISTHTTPTTVTTNLNANTYGTVSGYGNSASYNRNTYGTATTRVTGGEIYTTVKPRTSNTILCFTEKPDGFSYNAEFIVKSLGAKYGVKTIISKPDPSGFYE